MKLCTNLSLLLLCSGLSVHAQTVTLVEAPAAVEGKLELSLLNQLSGIYTAKVYTENSSFAVRLVKE